MQHGTWQQETGRGLEGKGGQGDWSPQHVMILEHTPLHVYISLLTHSCYPGSGVPLLLRERQRAFLWDGADAQRGGLP